LELPGRILETDGHVVDPSGVQAVHLDGFFHFLVVEASHPKSLAEHVHERVVFHWGRELVAGGCGGEEHVLLRHDRPAHFGFTLLVRDGLLVLLHSPQLIFGVFVHARAEYSLRLSRVVFQVAPLHDRNEAVLADLPQFFTFALGVSYLAFNDLQEAPGFAGSYNAEVGLVQQHELRHEGFGLLNDVRECVEVLAPNLQFGVAFEPEFAAHHLARLLLHVEVALPLHLLVGDEYGVFGFEEYGLGEHQRDDQGDNNEEEENGGENEEDQHPRGGALLLHVFALPLPVHLTEELDPVLLCVDHVVHALVQLYHRGRVEPDDQHIRHLPTLADFARQHVFHLGLDLNLKDHRQHRLLQEVRRTCLVPLPLILLNPAPHIENEVQEEAIGF